MAYKIIELSCIERENPGKPLQRDTENGFRPRYLQVDRYVHFTAVM